MSVINATPHVINVELPDGSIKSFPPCGKPARVTTIEGVVGEFDGIPLITRTWGEIVDFPEVDKDTEYVIVSSPVLDAAKASEDPYLELLLVSDSGPTAVRDEKGQIRAVKRFIVA